MAPKQKHRTKSREFTYTTAEANAIISTLRKAGLPKNANHTDLLIQITQVVRNTLKGKTSEAEHSTPPDKRVREKARRVTKGAEMLLKNIEMLGPEAEVSLKRQVLCHTNDRLVPLLTLADLQALLAQTAKWEENPTHRGPPKKRWEPTLVVYLAVTYLRATGRVPSRQHNQRTGKEYGPFRAFVHAVMNPAGLLPSPTSVDHLIRQVIPGVFSPKTLSALSPMVVIPPSDR